MKEITFKMNIPKALEAVLYIASKCSNAGYHLICKVIFFADVYHINKYGRPVIGDRYHAYPYGPVPETTYKEILKKDPLLYESLCESQDAFLVQYNKNAPIVLPQRTANMDYFSKTDIEALDQSIEKYGNMDFNTLTDISHKHKAWSNASGGEMDYHDFIDENNSELIQELEETASFMCL